MIKHEVFKQSGIISIWIGNFASDMDLDDYMNISKGFEQDFNIKLDDDDLPEVAVESSPVGVLSLVKGFSWSDNYANEVAKLASMAGVHSASAMVVAFNLKYDPQVAKAGGSAKLKFIGVTKY